jgi:hypothetical protein
MLQFHGCMRHSAGQGSANSRSDRITQAISASEDAIQQAVSGRSTASSATTKSKDFASLATRDATKPSDFGRRLRSGELLQQPIGPYSALGSIVLFHLAISP